MKNDFVNNHDLSVILRLTKDRFFIPLVNHIPARVKPNLITLFGFIAVLLFSYFNYLGNRSFRAGYLLAGLSLLVYLIADNIDGMHARNTNQTSLLGGFLDQWLDAVSFLVITMSLLSGLRVGGLFYILIVFLMAFINIILFYDQTKSGQFYKPPYGPNEFLLLMVLIDFLLFALYKHPTLVFHQRVFNGASLIFYITVALSTLYIIMAMKNLRLYDVIFPLMVHGIALVPFFVHRTIPPLIIGYFILIVNAAFIGRLLLNIYIPSGHPALFSLFSVSPHPLLKTAAAQPEDEAAVDKNVPN